MLGVPGASRVFSCSPALVLTTDRHPQYQPLSYEEQLELKRDVIRRSFANFSGLDPALVPAPGPTLASPLHYAYRTKLTPHFQVPPSGHNQKNRRKAKGKGKADGDAEAEQAQKEWEITIGFEQKGRKRIVDIEECVIATKVINDALVGEREKVKRCARIAGRL